ncbi:MAG: cobalamin-binding protein [Candidatus Omnitrophica bacterium]|nr:cobalamin-binding protein [Candidatus Omnitrophota bacterium]
MKKIIIIICLVLLFGQEQFPCAANNSSAETGTVPSSGAPRYISLAPSTTEILFALGLDDEIVGVSTYCNYPEETGSKTKIGDFSHPNMETIISLRPDYIFGTGLEQLPAIAELKKIFPHIYVADPATVGDLLKTINDIGALTNRTKEAQRLLRKMFEDIETVNVLVQSIPQDKRVKVFVEIWHEPLMTAGKGSFIDELITMAGGINVAHNVVRPFCNYSAEKVISLDPECIIMTYMDKEAPLKLLESRFGWGQIKAVKDKRVFNDIDPDILLRPGPRITDGLKEIFKRLYPQNAEISE